ncbi:uncharacterized protein LOC133181126 [Saccostrea echinata]|uniref:uncharacterized protein LOC133181126 n=1 Tax=Saccostrea echinata TaxID=191078 RepID=UPI002A819A11|nr:uncharacterized protein LOC133181126 [Saccostrea echinata]
MEENKEQAKKKIVSAQIGGCSPEYIAGRCDDTEFCFCKDGKWRRTNLSIAQTIDSTLISFSKLCVCTGSAFLSCPNKYYSSKLLNMSDSQSTLSDQTCTNSTANAVPAVTTNTEKSTDSTTTTETADQNCCCSAEFQAKVDYWKNETNQLLHRLNLDSSILEIRNELTMEKKNLSSIKRLRTCAPDQRDSAVVAGYIGAIIIIFVISVVIIIDLPILFSDIHKIIIHSCWDTANVEN